MRARALVTAAAVAAFTACQGDRAEWPAPVADSAGLAVYEALAPASPAPDVGSLYFVVVNHGATPESLLTIESAAAHAMLHTVVDQGGRSLMQPVGPVAIAPGDTLRLRPGGYHVMLSNLTRPLSTGDSIGIALGFSSGVSLHIVAAVLTYTEVVERLDRLFTP
jgi:periplasmic copper chaperone A